MLLVTNAVTAGPAVPTLATDGVSLRYQQPGLPQYYNWRGQDSGILRLKGAGTGALTFMGIVYLYDPLSAAWAPAGISSTIGNRGMLNDATTITGTTTFQHEQPIYGLSGFTRIYLAAPTTFTGTSLTVSCWLLNRDVNS